MPPRILRDRVFISYSHSDTYWLERLKTHLAPFVRMNGISLFSDQDIGPSAHWLDQIKQNLDATGVALLLVSPDYLASRFIVENELPPLLDAAENEGLTILWLLISACGYEETEISEYQAAHDITTPLCKLRPCEQDDVLLEACRKVKQALQARSLDATLGGVDRYPFQLAGNEKTGRQVSLSKLPTTLKKSFVNRQHELGELDTAWQDKDTRVVVLHGSGGIGKSALVNRWLDQFSAKQFGKADRVFGWSFYIQGSFDGTEQSSNPFFDAALSFFGAASKQDESPSQKCRRLLELLNHRCTLLVLDGLEPLQKTSGIDTGMILDPALRRFVHECNPREAEQGHGLCVISTRQEIRDLPTAKKIDVDYLTPDDGAELLLRLGVRGDLEKRKNVSARFSGHALSLTLLGRYLRIEFDGDINQWPNWQQTQGSEAEVSQLLKTIESTFPKGAPEIELMRLLGLFDRPVSYDLIDALLSKGRIAELTESLAGMTKPQFGRIVRRLRRRSLVFAPNSADLRSLDAHPLVRKYFAQQLQERFPATWREANEHLFNILRELGPDQDSLSTDKTPLFDAVVHGCRAGLLADAFDVYWERIINQPKYGTSFHDRGTGESFPRFVECLSAFFVNADEAPSARIRKQRPGKKLRTEQRPRLFEEAGHYRFLRGELGLAEEFFEKAIQIRRDDMPGDGALNRQEYIHAITRHSRLLREVLIVRGELGKACATFTQKDFEFARQSMEEGDAVIAEAAIGQCVHYFGRADEAFKHFREAERRQTRIDSSLLGPYAGVWWADYLFDCGITFVSRGDDEDGRRIFQEVASRADKMIEIASTEHWVVNRGQGKALKGLAIGMLGEIGKAMPLLDEAIEDLYASGQMHHLAWGLIARAWLLGSRDRIPDLRSQDIDPEAVEKAKNEAFLALQNSKRCGMELYEAEAQLALARLLFRNQVIVDSKGAEGHLFDAVVLLDKSCYVRRFAEAGRLAKSMNVNLKQAFGEIGAEGIKNTVDLFRKELDKDKRRLSIKRVGGSDYLKYGSIRVALQPLPD